jgi:hypothetical protein
MATVIRELLERQSRLPSDSPIAYFYCSRDIADPQRADPAEIMLALLKQIICSEADWQETSAEAQVYRERRKASDEDGDHIMRLNLNDALKYIIERSNSTPLVIVIDALDECTVTERYQLLGALTRLVEESGLIVKILVSSRDDADIVNQFQKTPNIRIEVGNNSGDVLRFVQAELRTALTAGRILNGRVPQHLRDEIHEVLSTKAQGM